MKLQNLLFIVVLLAVALPAVAVETADAPQTSEELLAVAVDPDASLHDRGLACEKLAAGGTPEVVEPLAKLLADDKLSHYARYALESNPDAAVDAAFLKALGELKGLKKIGVINSLGVRAKPGAVDALAELLDDQDEKIAAASAMALGCIADDRSVSLLTKKLGTAPASLKPGVADACVTCIQKLQKAGKTDAAVAMCKAVRTTAGVPKYMATGVTQTEIVLQGAAGIPLLVEQLDAEDPAYFAVALSAAREVPGPEATRACLDAYTKLPESRKVLMLELFGDRGDKAAVPVAIEAAKSDSKVLRLAAINATKKMGAVEALPVLLSLISSDDEATAEAAKETIIGFSDEGVNDTLLGLPVDPSASSRDVIISIIGKRRINSAVDLLLKATGDSDPAVQKAAWLALGETLPFEKLSILLEKLLAVKDEDQKKTLRTAVHAATIRLPDTDACVGALMSIFPKADLADKDYILTLVSELGGNKALEVIAESAKSDAPEVQDIATRVLGEWMSPDAAPVLLNLSKTLDDGKYKVRVMRGYFRIVRQLKLSDAERLDWCRKGLDVAWRPQEQNLGIDTLSRIPTPAALKATLPYLAEPKLKEVAGRSAVAIAKKVIQWDKPSVAAAMAKVIEAKVSPETTQDAKILLKRAK